MTSVVIGASSVAQLNDNLGALDHLTLTAEDLVDIDAYAVDEGINLWAAVLRRVTARRLPWSLAS